MSAVKLVWATEGGDDLIAKMARVSNPANEDNKETAPKLISYLIKNKHWSPFEMVNMCVEIETTRSVAAQILRHRSFSFQEFSQRYAEVILRPELPAMRRQDLKNRQNSVDDLPLGVLHETDHIVGQALVTSYRAYDRLLELGVAKECAREVLPLCTPTRLYMNGSARSWLHYLQLRTDPSTQKEHRDIAEQIKNVFIRQFPNAARAVDFVVT
jgi:thymidylate synthase (FAD)